MKPSDAVIAPAAPAVSHATFGAALSLLAVIAGVAMDVLAKTAAITAAPCRRRRAGGPGWGGAGAPARPEGAGQPIMGGRATPRRPAPTPGLTAGVGLP